MSVTEAKRAMQTDADMEIFFKELIPHLKGLEELLGKYAGERSVHISVSNDGYVNAGIYSTGFEIWKMKDTPYRIRKEYAAETVFREVG